MHYFFLIDGIFSYITSLSTRLNIIKLVMYTVSDTHAEYPQLKGNAIDRRHSI